MRWLGRMKWAGGQIYGDVQTRSVSNLSYKGSAFVDNTVDCRRESALCAPERLFLGEGKAPFEECRGDCVNRKESQGWNVAVEVV